MNKDLKSYLENKEYNIMFERLLMMLKPMPHGVSKMDSMSGGEQYDYFGNLAESRIYAFSNEYLNSFFRSLDINIDRAFVVGSSGDQALHCIARGARDVTIADGNMWTKPFVELKMAAIKNLEFFDFCKYMSFDNILSHEYYAKVSHDLSEQSRAFWDSIMLEFGGRSASDVAMMYQIKRDMFQYTDENHPIPDFGKYESKFYTSKEYFEVLKENLAKAKVNIVIADFEKFPSVADGEYDFIMLSNIFDYVKDKKFFPVLNKLKDEHLTQNGKIQAMYIWANRHMERKVKNCMENLSEMECSIEILEGVKSSALMQKMKKIFGRKSGTSNKTSKNIMIGKKQADNENANEMSHL